MCGLNSDFLTDGLRTKYFTIGQITFKIASSKVVKHEKAYSEN